MAIFSRGLVGPGTPMQSYGANTRIANSSKLSMHVIAEATWETGSLEDAAKIASTRARVMCVQSEYSRLRPERRRKIEEKGL